MDRAGVRGRKVDPLANLVKVWAVARVGVRVRFFDWSICSACERMIVSGESKVKAANASICGAAPRGRASAGSVESGQRCLVPLCTAVAMHQI